MVAAVIHHCMEHSVSEERAFTACYDRHKRRVFRLCLRYGAGDAQWAEDVCQEVFLKLWQHLPRLNNADNLGAWLETTAARTAISRLRHDASMIGRVRRAWWRRGQGRRSPSTEEALVGKQTARAALTSLDSLPPRERVIFCLRALDGESQRDIAKRLTLSEGYVSKLLSRARNTLRAQGWQV